MLYIIFNAKKWPIKLVVQNSLTRSFQTFSGGSVPDPFNIHPDPQPCSFIGLVGLLRTFIEINIERQYSGCLPFYQMGLGAGLSRGSDPDPVNLHPDPQPRSFLA